MKFAFFSLIFKIKTIFHCAFANYTMLMANIFLINFKSKSTLIIKSNLKGEKLIQAQLRMVYMTLPSLVIIIFPVKFAP